MNSIETISEIVEPIPQCSEYDTLNRARAELEKGKPVALFWNEKWYLLLPEVTSGYSPTRRLIDLPLCEALLFSPELPITEALERASQERVQYALVVDPRDNSLLGMVSLMSLLRIISERAQEAVVLNHFFQESLLATRSFVWWLPLSSDETGLLRNLSQLKIYGPVEDLLGFPVHTFLEQPKFLFNRIHPDDRPELVRLTRQILESATPVTRLFRFQHRDSRWVWLRDYVYPEQDTSGRLVALHGIVSETTELISFLEEERLIAQVHRLFSEKRVETALQESFHELSGFIPTIEGALIIWISGEERPVIKTSWGRPEILSPLQGLCQRLIIEKGTLSLDIDGSGQAPFLIDAEHREPLYLSGYEQEGTYPPTIWIAPLLLKQDFISLLLLGSSKTQAFSTQNQRLLRRLLPAFAAAVEAWHYQEELKLLNVTLEDRVQQRTYELELLYRLSQQMGHVFNYRDLLQLMFKEIQSVISYGITAAIIIVNHHYEILIRATRPYPASVQAEIEKTLIEDLSRQISRPIKAQEVQTNLMEMAPIEETRLPMERLLKTIRMPLLVGDNVMGFLLIGTDTDQQLTKEQSRLLHTIASQSAIFIQRLLDRQAAEQQQLKSLIEYLPEGVLLLSPERRIVLANPVAQRYLPVLTGATVGEILTRLGNQPLDRLLSFPARATCHELKVEGIPTRIFEVVARPLETGPEAGGWVLVLKEVTEERNIQQQIQQQERLAAIGQLAAGIAHDFNNSLTAIIGFTQLIQMRSDIAHPVREQLNIIYQQSQRAAQLIRQILDFSRRSVSEKRPLDLAPVIKELVKLHQRTLPENIELKLEIGPGEYIVEADLVQMQQVVTNIVLNARDAMPEGGELRLVLSRLRVSADQPPPLPDMGGGEWIELKISDTGVGIPADVLPHIFEPFFTTKRPGQGTGLGLAQVYGIIKQHNGFIGVESQTGQGTTFTIYLPAITPKAPLIREERLEGLPLGQRETILLVEDEVMVAEVEKRMLEELGYRVLVARTGQEALETYRRHQEEIELVITDMVMPGMGGLELVRNLRSMGSQVKVIILSGYPLHEGWDNIEDEAIIGWLAKPVDSTQLAQIIRRALDKGSTIPKQKNLP